MLLKNYFLFMCIGLACLNLPVGLAIAAPRNNLVALTPPQIQAQVARFVVRIDGEGKGNGSGFIINKNGNTYTVLTNEHVIRNSNRQSITTPDGRKYSFTTTDIKILPGVDLAEITFVSTEAYDVAKFNTQGSIVLGSPVYVYGWNSVMKPIYSVRQPRFASGIISQILPIETSFKGNTLVFSGLPVVHGISGSPVVNENGEVVGIYSLGDEDNNSSTLGISILTYQQYANTAKVMPSPTPNVPNPQPRLQPTQSELGLVVASPPASLTNLLTSVDRAANNKQLTELLNNFDASYTVDGLSRDNWEKVLVQFWQRYPNLRYRTTIQNWKPDGTGGSLETLTQIEGSGIQNGKTVKLTAQIKSRQRIINGKIAQQEILSEKIVATSGTKPPTVDLRVPDKIRANADYSIEAIVQEPLGDDVMMGTITERAVSGSAYTRSEDFNLKLLSTGDLFKDAKAPGKPGAYWLSATFIRPDGMTTVTKRIHVLRR